MNRMWKQGLAWTRVAAIVTAGMLTGCSGKGAATRDGGTVGETGNGGVAATAGVMRVGVYDSRAVAVAYGRSKQHAKVLGELMSAHKQAKAAGDTARVAELEKQGEMQQVRLHLQAFSNAPVEDAMDAVREKLPSVMEKRGVSVLTAKADASAAGVEMVDVTYDVVLLFEPDAATLKIVADMKGKDALPIEQVAKMGAKE